MMCSHRAKLIWWRPCGVSHAKGIFARYWRISPLRRAKRKARDVGQAISRQFAGLVRKSVEVDSKLRFCGNSAAGVAHAPHRLRQLRMASAAADTRRERAKYDAPRVLILGMHNPLRLTLQHQCEAIGCIGVCIDATREAQPWPADIRFDLVLLDCDAPGIGRHELVSQIRRRQTARNGRHIPIIGISAICGDEHTLHRFECGMDGALGKPLRLQELRRVIDLWWPGGVSLTALESPDN
ncbi:response regulator [Burkholderia territorii]|uniref:response regulator n=1 Tax=Burkholderia territorii TaxID=1503055 RepID=UPI0009BF4FE5